MDGDLLKVESGNPHMEGVFEMNVYLVALVNDQENDENIFSKTLIGKHKVDPFIKGSILKQ